MEDPGGFDWSCSVEGKDVTEPGPWGTKELVRAKYSCGQREIFERQLVKHLVAIGFCPLFSVSVRCFLCVFGCVHVIVVFMLCLLCLMCLTCFLMIRVTMLM